MKHIIVLLLNAVLAATFSAQDEKNTYPFKEKYSFDGSDCGLEADIGIDNLELEAGKRYSVKYTINVRTHCPLYNPFFNGLIPAPGELAIYDEEKKYVANSTRWTGGSRRGTGRGDWLYMYDGFIGSRRSFVAGDPFYGGSTPLKDGTYYLQMIFYRSFYSPPWEDISPPQDDSYFYKTYSTAELFRSNAIKIKIVKAK